MSIGTGRKSFISMHIIAVKKSRKLPGLVTKKSAPVVTYSYLNDSTSTAVKRMQCS